MTIAHRVVSRSAMLALVAATAFGSVVGAETDAAAQYVLVPPPAPRRERVPPRPYPGAVWVGGYWSPAPRGGYAWRTGRWEAGRPGYYYVQPRWVRRGRGWQMRQGYWRR